MSYLCLVLLDSSDKSGECHVGNRRVGLDASVAGRALRPSSQAVADARAAKRVPTRCYGWINHLTETDWAGKLLFNAGKGIEHSRHADEELWHFDKN